MRTLAIRRLAYRHYSTISPKHFVNRLRERNINFFTGVPDSLLKTLSAHFPRKNHIIAINEGSAIGTAIGHYMATKQYPLVYMQNSGTGNTINPLVSLCSQEVFAFPMLLVIGWRGDPNGPKDEPQHALQGKIMLNLLVCKKGTFGKEATTSEKLETDTGCEYLLTRQEALQCVLKHLPQNSKIVSTTGMLSRELYEITSGTPDAFLTVGGMGHASSIALGIATGDSNLKNVVCMDGDGALLMHLGSIVQIGHLKPVNFVHFVFDNGAYDSVGGQPTLSTHVPDLFTQLAKVSGYNLTLMADDSESIRVACEKVFNEPGPSLIELKIKKGHKKNLPRPPEGNPKRNKEQFMNNLLHKM